MDSHDRYDRLLTTFLAGELDPAEARRWDEHLLECEACWRAVREDRAGRQGWPTGSRSPWRWPPRAARPRRGAQARISIQGGGAAMTAGRTGGWRVPGPLPP